MINLLREYAALAPDECKLVRQRTDLTVVAFCWKTPHEVLVEVEHVNPSLVAHDLVQGAVQRAIVRRGIGMATIEYCSLIAGSQKWRIVLDPWQIKKEKIEINWSEPEIALLTAYLEYLRQEAE